LQRIWIKANQDGLSFQPISASLFIFHRVAREEENGYSPSELGVIDILKKKLNAVFNRDLKNQEVFMFRINEAGDPSVRAFRRDVKDTLIVI
jgi:hypothetical protein